jgi:FeS assembly SUF system regulator
MLRISKLTDYATVILARLAARPDQRFTAAQLATETRLAAPTVSKLLKQLQRRDLVHSTRGLHGGYLLARPASQITAAQILDALEGPVALTECASSESHCCIETTCLVSKAWQRVNLAVRIDRCRRSRLTELAGLAAAQVTARPPSASLQRPWPSQRRAEPSGSRHEFARHQHTDQPQLSAWLRHRHRFGHGPARAG